MITGSIVALVTPMNADGSIAWSSLEKLIEFHLKNGTHALGVVGTTGEASTLDMKEHEAVIRFCVEKSAGRIPVVAGTGANSTREAEHLTLAAKKAGADAALLVTPYYNKPTQEGLFQHYQYLATHIDIPQILYNVPSRTACDLLPDLALRLANIDNIVGIKEATGDLERARYLIERAPKDFAIYSGDDFTAMELMLSGGHGSISVTANVVPAQISSLCQAALKGQRAQAEVINQRLVTLNQQLFVETNPIPVKWLLHKMGLMPEGIRLPLTALSNDYQVPLSTAFNEVRR